MLVEPTARVMGQTGKMAPMAPLVAPDRADGARKSSQAALAPATARSHRAYAVLRACLGDSTEPPTPARAPPSRGCGALGPRRPRRLWIDVRMGHWLRVDLVEVTDQIGGQREIGPDAPTQLAAGPCGRQVDGGTVGPWYPHKAVMQPDGSGERDVIPIVTDLHG